MILGIDYGQSKIGLAVADELTRMALPFKVIHQQDLQAQIEAIRQIVQQMDVDLLVIGLPKSLKNKDTQQTVKTKQFIEQMQQLSIEVVTEDERLTSQGAKSLGIDADDDAVAAMQILQSYLDIHS